MKANEDEIPNDQDDSTTFEITLLRHGESVANAEDIWRVNWTLPNG
jgi:hypothetical protein